MRELLFVDAEEAITSKIRVLARNIDGCNLNTARDIQIDFLVNSLLSDEEVLQNEFINACVEICRTIGIRYLLRKPSVNMLSVNGLVVIANHLGLNKLTKIPVRLLNDNLCAASRDNRFEKLPPLTNDDPFVLLFAPIIGALCDMLSDYGKHFSIVTMDYPDPYLEIVQRTGGVVIKLSDKNKYRKLVNNAVRISKFNKKNQRLPVFVFFPEGGTSGKRNNGSPYSLGDFKNGYARLAYDLNIPILPVVTYIDHQSVVSVKNLRIKYSSANYDVCSDRSVMQEVISKNAL